MDTKIEPHRARSITYVIRRNYKKKTAELKKRKKRKKLALKDKNLIDNLKLSDTKNYYYYYYYNYYTM